MFKCPTDDELNKNVLYPNDGSYGKRVLQTARTAFAK